MYSRNYYDIVMTHGRQAAYEKFTNVKQMFATSMAPANVASAQYVYKHSETNDNKMRYYKIFLFFIFVVILPVHVIT